MTDLPPNIDGRLGHDVVVIDGRGLRTEGRLVAYAPQPSVIIERTDGQRVSYPVTMVQPRPLRELVAELIENEHDPYVGEGGCDFRASSRGEPHGFVDQIIALVRNHPGPHEGDAGTCAVCAMYGDYTGGRWVHRAPDAPIARGHEFVVA